MDARRVRRLTRGIYQVVDPVRDTPAIAVADALFADVEHYVTTDAALAFHRAIDQPVPEIVVVAAGSRRPVRVGTTRVRRVALRPAAFLAADAYATSVDGFRITVAAREQAIVDALAEPSWMTHLTLLPEVLAALDDDELQRVADGALRRSTAAAQRLGFLLDEAQRPAPPDARTPAATLDRPAGPERQVRHVLDTLEGVWLTSGLARRSPPTTAPRGRRTTPRRWPDSRTRKHASSCSRCSRRWPGTRAASSTRSRSRAAILMAGELGSPRASADIDATSGEQKRVDVDVVAREIVRAGRRFAMRLDGEPERTRGGHVIHLAFESLTDRGIAKFEISVREDLVFAVRDAVIDLSSVGLSVFSVPAVAEVELVAEKLRCLVQRAQPRDLFDLRLYLVDSGWHFDPHELRAAVDGKLATTRLKRWSPEAWRAHLDEIEPLWEPTLLEWVAPDRLPAFEDAVREVDRRLRQLGLG